MMNRWHSYISQFLTHWGWVTHICVRKLTIIGSDNGLSPRRRQAIIRTNAEILLIQPLGTKFSEIWIEIITFSFKKMYLKVSSAKRQPFCLGLNGILSALSLRIVPLWQVLEHLWDCSNVNEATVKYMGGIQICQNTTECELCTSYLNWSPSWQNGC